MSRRIKTIFLEPGCFSTENRCGVCMPPDDADALYETILKMKSISE